MIVNTEIHDYTRNGVPVLYQKGRTQKFLVISYVDKNQTIKPIFWMKPNEPKVSMEICY